MVCVQVFEQFTVKMWEIQEYHKIGITSRSITVTLKAKESLMKHIFITNFISNLLMNQTHLFCCCTCDIIKSNE